MTAKAWYWTGLGVLALGRTKAGIDHMESARARVEEQRARVAAAQARIDANSARLEALSAGRKFRRMNVLADYSDMSGSVIEVPSVRISQDKILVQGPTGMVVCPRLRMKTPLVAVPAPPVSIMQDPI